MVWNIKFINYRENKLIATKYVQNGRHWHEAMNTNMQARSPLVNCVINQQLLQAAPHMQ